MNIDKQALREVAEKALPAMQRLLMMPNDELFDEAVLNVDGDVDAANAFNLSFGPETALALLDELECQQTFQQAFFRQSLMYDVVAEAYEEAKEQIAKDVEIKSRLCLESNSLFDRLRAAEKRIAELTDQKATWVSWAENASGMVDMLRLRIAELERSETQLINERDCAESALADMYQAATGERPEWSNMFGFADAVDVVEERLATLESNQSQTTPTGIQFITEAIGAHGYIVGCLLQGRPDLALEESRKWVSAFGQAGEIVSAQDAAGIKVKGE